MTTHPTTAPGSSGRHEEDQVLGPQAVGPVREGLGADPVRLRAAGPRIRVSRGVGQGPTRLAAFDAALVAAGLQDFNLVPLSSVVPLGATVEVVGPAEQLRGRHGDLLYCVYAAGCATTRGAEAWAGVAWGLRTDGSGAGLFVEHSGASEDEVQRDLDATLGSMMDNRPEHYVEGGRLLACARYADQPTVALVLASFQRAGWAAPEPTGTSR